MKIICIEGENAIGKSTQIRLIHDLLYQRGVRVIQRGMFHSYHSEFSDIIRKYILQGGLEGALVPQILTRMLMNHFNEASKELVREIKQWKDGIKKKDNRPIVALIDRYFYSTYAYQGAQVREMYGETTENTTEDMRFFHDFNEIRWHVGHYVDKYEILIPDLALYLDTPKNFQEKNLVQMRKETLDTFEKRGRKFQEYVREMYLRMCDEGCWGLRRVVINDKYNSEGSIIYENLRVEIEKFLEEKVFEKRNTLEEKQCSALIA